MGNIGWGRSDRDLAPRIPAVGIVFHRSGRLASEEPDGPSGSLQRLPGGQVNVAATLSVIRRARITGSKGNVSAVHNLRRAPMHVDGATINTFCITRKDGHRATSWPLATLLYGETVLIYVRRDVGGLSHANSDVSRLAC